MKKKELLGLLVLALFAVVFCLDKAEAQSKVIRKTVKKVVTPQLAPVEPPKEEVTPEAGPLPPPPPTFEVELQEKPKGIFGWGLNADVAGKFLVGSGWLLGVRGDIIFADPLHLGEKIGLAEDAVEYKAGLGFGIGATSGNRSFNTIPLFADAVVYLKEKSFFSLDPFAGAGLILNLFGTGGVSGGLGGQLYFGILADFGFESGKTEIALGYGSYKVANTHSADGIFFSVTQPLIL